MKKKLRDMKVGEWFDYLDKSGEVEEILFINDYVCLTKDVRGSYSTWKALDNEYEMIEPEPKCLYRGRDIEFMNKEELVDILKELYLIINCFNK